MWKRILLVNQVAYYLNRINLRFNNAQKHSIKTEYADRDVFGLFEKSSTHLYFTSEEKEKAKAGLKKMGIEEDAPFVCVVNRDSAYLSKTFPKKDWSYHNFRDSNIQNYTLAADWLTTQNYFVIRMGSEVKELMRTNNPMTIEYAHKGFRTELLDIYLGANCYFFISNGTGIDTIPKVFRRPILYVNYHIVRKYELFWNLKSLGIFKKYWLKNERRFMTFREILNSPVCGFFYLHEYEECGIELIENTPEEILDATIEMEERLKGTWQVTEEDEELHRRCCALFKTDHKAVGFRIGSRFLFNNRDLID